MQTTKPVCNYLQAKRLQELGLNAPSFYRWYLVSNGDDEGDFTKEGVDWHPVLCQYDERSGGDWSVESIDSDLTTSDGEFCSHQDPVNAYAEEELVEIIKFEGKRDSVRLVDGQRNSTHTLGRHTGEGPTWPEALADLIIKMLEAGKLTSFIANRRLIAATTCIEALNQAGGRLGN